MQAARYPLLLSTVFAAVVLLFLTARAHPAGHHRRHDGDERKDKSPAKVVALPKGFKPEGIAQGWNNNVYVASMTGKVTKVNVVSKKTRDVVSFTNPFNITQVTAVGLKVSLQTGLMFVAGGLTGLAYVVSLDPSTGRVKKPTKKAIQTIPLSKPGASLVNDVALRHSTSKSGKISVTAYFTDSFGSSVFEVSGCPKSCKISGNYTSPAFVPVPIAAFPVFGLNGLVAEPLPRNMLVLAHYGNAKLLTAVISKGKLIKVTNVTITENKTPLAAGLAADGLLLVNKNTLYAVDNNAMVAKLRFTKGDYTAAAVLGRSKDPLFASPATIAKGAGKLYATNAHFFDASNVTKCAAATPCPNNKFELIRVDL